MDPVIAFDPNVNPAPAVIPYEDQMALAPAVRKQYVHSMDWDRDTVAAFDYLMTQVIMIGNNGVTALKDQGINRVSHIVALAGEEAVEKVVVLIRKILSTRTGPKDFNPITQPSTQKLIGLYKWAAERKAMKKTLVPSDFTQEKCEEWMATVRDRKEKDKGEVVTKFKAGMTFKMFHQEFETHLATIKGEGGTTLNYIIRKDDVVPEGDLKTNKKGLKAQVAPLDGPFFADDNEDVWLKLKLATLGSPAWHFISKYDATYDGRSAYKALRDHYEGEAQMGRTAKEAYKKLAAVRYTGEKHNFDYEKYIAVFQENFRVLEDHGQPVPEFKKVYDFLEGMDTSDPSIKAGIAKVDGDAELKNDFAGTCAYMAHFIKPNKPGLARSIGAAGTSDRKAAKKGGKGGKKTGTGTGIDANGYKYAFTTEEWSQLTDAEKEAVKKRRAAYSETKKNKKRKVAALTTKAAAEEGSGPEEDPEDSEGENQAGKQFGKRNHKKAKTS
jgi:hypothetical protein